MPAQSATTTPQLSLDNTSLPYDHPWATSFDPQQQQPAMSMEQQSNIWQQYIASPQQTGPSNVAGQQQSPDVWDQYMTPPGFGDTQQPTTMQFAHAFFKDDINDDQQQYDFGGQQQMQGQTGAQQPSGALNLGPGSSPLMQPEVEQCVRSEEQLTQSQAPPGLLQQNPQFTQQGFPSGGPKQSIPPPQQQVPQNIGKGSPQPDLVAGVGHSPTASNLPPQVPFGGNVQFPPTGQMQQQAPMQWPSSGGPGLPHAVPQSQAQAQQVPANWTAPRNTQGPSGQQVAQASSGDVQVEEATEASMLDDLHID